MLNPIFETMLDPDKAYMRFERYDGVRGILTISTETHEVQITDSYIKLDEVRYNQNLVNSYHGVPIYRNLIVMIDYNLFLESNSDEVLGVSKDDVTIILEYYKRLG
ncbi:hypothetical protein [Yersinia phage fHe-Yen9-04]|uniref:Uncharacterized protein n=2 Tax=Eneladusvirus Yen904 TaxID=2560849 RepID=A0A2C9CXZ4_9CAUD|nr:hypothetical protein FDJ41_gp369 [Yersinia phage fHe-Yen9-04]SOK58646.1 hypothetical protein [Yersinia phage fHe-Yen9-04]SOK59180.1 hypothetical protein [Yersinia phage fHe-Yen9-03]VUE36415.1 hypothetical protein [Yersinia phage fHe-Yen9-04]